MLMLLDDAETTMLLLEMLDDIGIRRVEGWQQQSSEQDVLRGLIELEGLGLVTRREDSIDPQDLVVPIPEYRLGRSTVVWWALTDTGRSLILQDMAGGAASPP